MHGRPPTARNAQQMFSTFHVRINPVMWTTKKQPFPTQLFLFQYKTSRFLTALIVISARRPFQSNNTHSIFLSHPLSSLRACASLFLSLKNKLVPAIELLLNSLQITHLEQLKSPLSLWSAVNYGYFFCITSQSGFFAVCFVYIL